MNHELENFTDFDLQEASRSAFDRDDKKSFSAISREIIKRIDLKAEDEEPFDISFAREVLVQYLEMGSKLRNTVRIKNNVVGTESSFKHPFEDYNTYCLLLDYYAGDWVDQLDELKTNPQEFQVVARDGAACALGRKSDELIISQLHNVTNFAGTDEDGLTMAKVLRAFEMLGGDATADEFGHKPEFTIKDEYFAIVGWKQWSDLLGIREFANADYVGDDELPWKGTQAKRWLSTLWIPHPGLTKTQNTRLCHWYRKSAIGHAVGDKITTRISWHENHLPSSHFLNNCLAQGSTLLDQGGIVTMKCRED